MSAQDKPSCAQTLAELPVGSKGTITGFELAPQIKQRLMELGLTRGTECKVLRFAPMGDPVEILVREYHLSLRKSEAEGILVKELK
jgi:ferrous iron transport protein A